MSLPPLTSLDVAAVNRLVAQMNRDARKRDDKIQQVSRSVTELGRRLPETIRQVAATQARQQTSTQASSGAGTARTLTSTETHLIRQVAFRAITSLQTTADAPVLLTLGTSPQTLRTAVLNPTPAQGQVIRILGAGAVISTVAAVRHVGIFTHLSTSAVNDVAVPALNLPVNNANAYTYVYEVDYIIRTAAITLVAAYAARAWSMTQTGAASPANPANDYVGATANVFAAADLAVQEIVTIDTLDANVTVSSEFWSVEVLGGRTG